MKKHKLSSYRQKLTEAQELIKLLAFVLVVLMKLIELYQLVSSVVGW